MSEEPGKYTAGREERHSHSVKDEAPPRDNFTQIPNIADYMHLSPQAYRLYSHLRRVIGVTTDGSCWQSTATMAKICNMSGGMVSKAKHELMKTTPPLILVEVKQKKEGGFYHDITLTDVWSINHEYFTDPKARSQYERVHNMNEHVHNVKPLISPLKKNTSKTSIFPANADPAWQLAGGVTSEEIAAGAEKIAHEKATADRWEREMGYNPLPWWDDRKLIALLRFLGERTAEEIHAFAEWSKRPFSPLSPGQARKNPGLVIDLWPQSQRSRAAAEAEGEEM